ncbi:hypothetical protein [Candidatus Viridilinea mediisalina]|uniref:Uncharacterized protein n=1 Tax=Candidatus Viridilinea mediisalina TaxID=2024553 RepID=A0A2A6RF53_9CHLR|nr:hypothetical protein [Candidatus Viridilinea mediisalina]PDW01573.1 hypothetical protein CJ255_18375 [Candidatus Viridilinea mediisalina]
MSSFFFVLGVGLAFTLLALVLWRIWAVFVRRTPDQEAHERDLAALNDAQANRISDSQLTRPLDPDSAWRTMVQRGKRKQRGSSRK